jgi:hypothetical protein
MAASGADGRFRAAAGLLPFAPMADEAPSGAPPGGVPLQHTVVRKRPDCAQLFSLFMGLGQRLMLPPFQFIQATGIADRNLIAYRDVRECLYQRGVSDDLPNLESFLSHERRSAGRLPWVKRRYAVGTSGGAYMAIVAGHVNRAEAVWAFAPPTKVGERYAVPGQERFRDLAELLGEHNGVTQYRVYYNASEAPDVEAAERLARCPGVTLLPQEGQGHFVVSHLLETGQLATILPPFESSLAGSP